MLLHCMEKNGLLLTYTLIKRELKQEEMPGSWKNFNMEK